MRDRELRRQRQSLLVRRAGLGVLVQSGLDVADSEISAWALGILGDELLRRRELAAGVVLEPLTRDRNLHLLGVRRFRGERLGARQVRLELVERVAGVRDVQISDGERGISRHGELEVIERFEVASQVQLALALQEMISGL